MTADKEQIIANWDFSKIPSPCYVLHTDLLQANLQTIDKVRKATKAEIIVALKANAMWSIFPVLKQHSDGATASSLAEARLVFEEYGDKTHTYAPVYTEAEIDELLSYSSHITFNSLGQYRRFGERAHRAGVSCGLRINPEYSTVETDLYNPCDSGSRLGIRSVDLPDLPDGATFARRDGVASVSARVARDTLYIVATCDSLQRLVWAYERRLAGEASESATTERHADWRPVRLWPYLLAIVALFVLIYALKRPERHISQQ